ncbi:MAG: restriction endonuclease subunit R, partial [Desulfobulbaceae bacterium]|nr:restriction endonuclease subunit R [Desulfobulbaceae bacterium]
MPLTEAQTRQKLIDEKLGFAGWNVNDPSQVIQELDIDLVEAGVLQTFEKPPTPYSCHQFADYVLLRHGKPLAVVEAKRTSKDANLGKEQALQYAQNLQKLHGGNIPFIFYT